ncbi:MAG: TetR/AcrR family transcriptional regulator [Clostridia bacterium]|nr:TetR/AcrR family transcriptional regulator [Clostridia bacterium]
MNTPNNKRRRESRQRLEAAFIHALQTRELKEITVTDLCREAKVNRTTFYANYTDVYALADAVQQRLEEEVSALYDHRHTHEYSRDNYLKLFRHIRDNQLFYKTYFKLGVDGRFRLTAYDVRLAAAYYGDENIEYHVEFFRNGLNAVIKKWLQNGCRESPEEIQQIIASEYRGKILL